MVPLQYLLFKISFNFCRTLEMLLINCEINAVLTCSANFLIIDQIFANQINTNICINWYKTLYSSFNFLNSRYCKATTAVETKF